MELQSINTVYSSPTGKTKAAAQGIVRGINPVSLQMIDITKPDARKLPLLIYRVEKK